METQNLNIKVEFMGEYYSNKTGHAVLKQIYFLVGMNKAQLALYRKHKGQHFDDKERKGCPVWHTTALLVEGSFVKMKPDGSVWQVDDAKIADYKQKLSAERDPRIQDRWLDRIIDREIELSELARASRVQKTVTNADAESVEDSSLEEG